MIDLAQIEAAISYQEKLLERERGELSALAARGTNALKLAKDAEQQALACEKASRLIAQFADSRQQKIIQTIETIASAGLSTIFEEKIELKIEQVTRARRIEMDVKIKTGELETSILDARGGGLAAVAGFLLRITVLLLTKDVRKFIAADEPFSQLSDEYLVPTAEFLADICRRADLQLILVTHQPEFAEASDRVLRIIKTETNTAKVIVEK